MKQTLRQKLKRRLIVFLARRLPPCNVIVPMISEARERPLSTREKVILRLHFFTCEACRRYAAQIARISEMLKPQIEEPFTETLSDAARARIKTALETAARREN